MKLFRVGHRFFSSARQIHLALGPFTKQRCPSKIWIFEIVCLPWSNVNVQPFFLSQDPRTEPSDKMFAWTSIVLRFFLRTLELAPKRPPLSISLPHPSPTLIPSKIAPSHIPSTHSRLSPNVALLFPLLSARPLTPPLRLSSLTALRSPTHAPSRAASRRFANIPLYNRGFLRGPFH